jgi:large conductance mechanosensitive channel
MSFIDDFKQFALRGNMTDMAVGFTVGAAFTSIAKSLVDDVIMPIVGLAVGKVDFTNMYMLLRAGAKAPGPYETLADARAAGAVTLNYGAFINNIIAFLLIALAMFFLLRFIKSLETQLENRFAEKKPEEGEPTTKKCPFCLSNIAYASTRCAFCTSPLEEAEARIVGI